MKQKKLLSSSEIRSATFQMRLDVFPCHRMHALQADLLLGGKLVAWVIFEEMPTLVKWLEMQMLHRYPTEKEISRRAAAKALRTVGRGKNKRGGSILRVSRYHRPKRQTSLKTKRDT